MTTDCFACQVAEKHPATNLRGNANCTSCDARGLAMEFTGLPPETVTPALSKAWPDTKQFRTGRALFWMWAKRITEAKEMA